MRRQGPLSRTGSASPSFGPPPPLSLSYSERPLFRSPNRVSVSQMRVGGEDQTTRLSRFGLEERGKEGQWRKPAGARWTRWGELGRT